MMSGGDAAPRSRWAWGSILVGLGFVLGFKILFHFTGLDESIKDSPALVATIRILIVLVFGGAAVALLFFREEEEGPRRLRDWFYAAFALAVAILNAVLLIGGEDTI
ncbi:MAG TPA: hypothetical protein VEZ70_02285 [Allosphingosinicella sp.]|nr:hypothetical protein [Allosphingosinicella sp.]